MNPDFDWHTRFQQQSKWTYHLRRYLFEKTRIPEADAILELGCGTGAILEDIPEFTKARIFGLDFDPVMISQCRKNAPAAKLTIADAHHLPFPSNEIDITFCHFLFLWVRYPLQVLIEMKRVTRSGGTILVMAEPNYLERIDKPENLRELGQLQNESLIKQGANLDIGSRLFELFKQADINLVEAGNLDVELAIKPDNEMENLEWSVMEEDIKKYLTPDQLDAYRRMDAEARHNGTRILHVPTSFAWGLV